MQQPLLPSCQEEVTLKDAQRNVNWYYVELTKAAGHTSPAVKAEVCYEPSDYKKLWELLKSKSGKDAYVSPSGSGTYRSGGSAESQPNKFKAAASRTSKDGDPGSAEVEQFKADVEKLKKNVKAEAGMHKTEVDKLKDEVDKLKREVDTLKAEINTLRQEAASEIRQVVGRGRKKTTSSLPRTWAIFRERLRRSRRHSILSSNQWKNA